MNLKGKSKSGNTVVTLLTFTAVAGRHERYRMVILEQTVWDEYVAHTSAKGIQSMSLNLKGKDHIHVCYWMMIWEECGLKRP
jgi:L-rhamnose mutarotase